VHLREIFASMVACGVFLADLAPGHAETVAIACEDLGGTGQQAALALTYEGEAQGTLKVTGSLGEMSLPAVKGPGTVTIEDLNDGKPYFGIRAAGPASVIMPDKASVEACVAGKLTPEEAEDADSAFVTVAFCTSRAPLTAAPVAIEATVEVAFVTDQHAGPGAPLLVTIDRTSVETSPLPGGKFHVESTEKCEVVAPQ
jgi:hypothetical protein